MHSCKIHVCLPLDRSILRPSLVFECINILFSGCSISSVNISPGQPSAKFFKIWQIPAFLGTLYCFRWHSRSLVSGNASYKILDVVPCEFLGRKKNLCALISRGTMISERRLPLFHTSWPFRDISLSAFIFLNGAFHEGTFCRLVDALTSV